MTQIDKNEKKNTCYATIHFFQLMELYDMVKKWNSVSDTLPQVVDRLVSLKDLHEQG